MTKLSVKKPYTVLVAIIAVIALGIVSLTGMQADLLPDMSIPYLIVITTYPGASPERIEATVTEPLESALGTVTGVENVTSTSSENYCTVQLEFADGTDMDSALVKVYSALEELELPEEAGTPSIMELSMNMLANQYLGVSYEGMDIYELSDFVSDEVAPYFERQDGVASASSIGLVTKTVSVELDAKKVQRLNDRILALTNKEFAKALKDIEEGEQALIDAQQELEDGKVELEEQKQTLIDKRQELADGWVDYEDAVEELADAKKDLKKSIKDLKKGIDQMNSLVDADMDFDLIRNTVRDRAATIAYALSQDPRTAGLPATISGLESDKSDLEACIAGLKAVDENDPQIPVLEGQLEELNSGLEQAKAGLKVAEDAANAEINKQLSPLIEGYDGLREAAGLSKSGLKASSLTAADVDKIEREWLPLWASANSYMRSAQTQLEAAESQLDASDKQLDSLKSQLETAEEQLDSGDEQILDAEEQLVDAQKKIDDGWVDYKDGLRLFEKQRQQAMLTANADQLVSLSTLSQIIYAQDFEMPAGYIDDKEDNSWLLKIGTSFENSEELEDAVLTNIHDLGDVKLSDVANITIIDNADDSYAKMNGREAVLLSIFKSSTFGTSEVSEGCKEAIAALEEKYPGLSIEVLMDQGDYIKILTSSIASSMLLGGVLAIAVLAVFLKDILPTLVVAISIPLSLLLAIVCMYFSDISLNLLTLAGLALGVGMLVDNSIVVIENIYRLRALGIAAPRAAVYGAKQVAGPIISSTLTTICVFFPMLFTEGTIRDLIMPMGLTVAYCLIASLIIALTVVPASGSTLLKNTKAKEHPFFDKLMAKYEKFLRACLNKKAIALLVAVALFGGSVFGIIKMGVVMIPDMASEPLAADVSMPEDMDKETCFKTADEVIDAILGVEGVETIGAMESSSMLELFSSAAGGGEGNFRNYLFYVLIEGDNPKEAEVKRIAQDIKDATQDLDCTVSISTSNMDFSALMESGLTIRIYGSNLTTIADVSEEVMELVKQVPGYKDVSNGMEDGDDVIHLVIDKNKAMSYGLSVAQIYMELTSQITSEASATDVEFGKDSMEVVIKDETNPLTVENLLDYKFKTSMVDDDNDTITVMRRLGSFATIEREKTVAAVNRSNQTRYMTVTASVEEGYNATLLARELQPLIKAYEAPAGYQVEMGGESEMTTDMLVQMSKVAALGLLFIYLIMVAQFQNLLSPFIVLFTIPLAFTGGLLGLMAVGEKLSMLSLIGFIILMGTVVNNGIVFVDYANQLRMAGWERRDALVETGKTRMRPILMTALTTILAMSKILLGTDVGSQMGKGMSIVIMAGLAYATLTTLIIIPIVYDMLYKRDPKVIDIGDDDLSDIPLETAPVVKDEAEEAFVYTEEDAAAEAAAEA